MKALVKKFPERGLWMEEVPEPSVGPNDVKIKIHKTAICGTDLHIYNWDEWSQKTIRGSGKQRDRSQDRRAGFR